MADSFFGFDTTLPQRRQQQHPAKNTGNKPTYDFEEIGQQLDDIEVDDGLGDQLDEQGDDLNDETFGDTDLGQDFDFASSSAAFERPTRDPPANESLYKDTNVQGHWGAYQRDSPHSVGSYSSSNDWQRNQPQQNNTRGAFPYILHEPWNGYNGEASAALNHGHQGGLSPFKNHQQLQPMYSHSPPGLSPSSSFGHQQHRAGQPLSLEELEARMRQQPRNVALDRDVAAPVPTANMMSLHEIEANLRNNQTYGMPPTSMHQPSYPQHASPYGFRPPPTEREMEELLRRQQQQLQQQQQSLHSHRQHPQQQDVQPQQPLQKERQPKEPVRKSKYDGLMTQHDKDFIQRIQLSQLVTGDPYAEDYYYQTYTKSNPVNMSREESSGGRDRKEENMMQRMKRMLNHAKKHPKQNSMMMEGALGKITSLSVRNPREALQVPKNTEGAQTDKEQARTGRKMSNVALEGKKLYLSIIERKYAIMLSLEELIRREPQPSETDPEKAEEARARWAEKKAEKSEELLKGMEVSKILEGIIKFDKGRRLILCASDIIDVEYRVELFKYLEEL